MTRLGSLCTGYGGLEQGLAQLFDFDLAWVSDIDKGANKILAARHPDVPNLGDFTTAQNVTAVDVLCAGFPCQPVSHAGKRAGTDDERWLFDDITRLVGLLDPRPRLLVFENVLGLLSANRGHAMARVVHGLAQIGYVGRWRTLRASDVGAPHRRERVFIVAAPADTRGIPRGRNARAPPTAQARRGRRPREDRSHEPRRAGSRSVNAMGRLRVRHSPLGTDHRTPRASAHRDRTEGIAAPLTPLCRVDDGPPRRLGDRRPRTHPQRTAQGSRQWSRAAAGSRRSRMAPRRPTGGDRMSADAAGRYRGDTEPEWGRLNDDIADCLRRLADLAVAARAMAQSVHILGDPDEPGWFDAMRFDPERAEEWTP